jgi:hypothetical protein
MLPRKEKMENDKQNKLESITGKEEIEENPFVDVKFVEVANTVHDHYYVEDPIQDLNNEMTQLICTGCPSGCSIADDLKVVDGKIIKK